ncbi:MAG: hypothetical protein IJ275_03465 [Ruminococcus sp.]|nr:hypothetical protein [Ruminococcus sp.]
MKRLVAILLSILLIVSLAGCSIGTDGTKLNGDTVSTEATQAPDVDINKYKKDFNGMQDYLKELELISKKDGDKTEMQAELIGAKQGVRYKIDTTNFVEFYEFDVTATPDEAEKILTAFSNDETYKVLGIEDVKGVVSSSGKYAMLYVATSTYDYSDIIEEFSKF